MTKPMRCSNNEFAHEWAYNHERDLRTNCGNMHTRGNTCYSYSTAIAYKIIDKNVLLLAREGFSNTTRKQKCLLRRAFAHWHIIEVFADNIPEYDFSLERLLKKEVKECIERLTDMLKNTKKNKQGVFALAEDRKTFCEYVRTLNEISKYVDHDLYDTETKMNKRFLRYANKLSSYDSDMIKRREEARKERERKAAEELAKRCDAAVKLFNQELGCAVKDAKYSKLIDAMMKASLPKMLSLVTLEEYFDVDGSYSFVWRMGGDVKTSQYITVPWKAVELLLRLWKAGKPILGKQVGQYTVSAVNDDYVQVGCHRIPVANLNALYREEIDECRDVL